ncbi:hypothetical protein SSX86_031496 [Deinandra increscens subsp. villosa]|uniref:F-box domain-containing protein n=1 Tax=Deinandra increscens subsp. villosa TaxID=3103831 RepID=A0AAP0C403_9ASTR
MDKLPHSLLLQILSRLDDSADVTRCRVASKAFNTVFPGLRSINLQCSQEWYSRASSSQRIKPFKTVFLDLISKLETVESVCIRIWSRGHIVDESPEFYLTHDDFSKEWMPRVSGSLKSLSISDLHNQRKSNILPLISTYCHNLVNLELECIRLFVDNLNPMSMLTSLKLGLIVLEEQHLKEFNKCFPNLRSLTLITHILFTSKNVFPNLNHCEQAEELPIKKFEKLKTLWLDSLYIGSLVSEFSITETVENLTLCSKCMAPRYPRDSKFSLRKVFRVFPNVSSLCIRSDALLHLEACSDPVEDWAILDGRKGLKTICAYLKLVDSSLTFSSIACVLDQCIGLSEVSLLIHANVNKIVSKGFTSKCMARWPWVKWRWGIWSEDTEDSWISNIWDI